MREECIYAMLRAIKRISRVFYRFDIAWVHQPPADPWRQLRLVTFLNHTSLYEPLFVGGFPDEFLKRIAFKGLMPVADKATRRPVMGFFSAWWPKTWSPSRAKTTTRGTRSCPP